MLKEYYDSDTERQLSAQNKIFPQIEEDLQPQIYGAVYSGVPVYEMVCRDVPVMRRRSDSYLNVTQILKVAGVEKARRTKILEKEILCGQHEKVQGGYGKYQGTWIPFERGFEIAKQFGVIDELRPLFEIEPMPTADKSLKSTHSSKETLVNVAPLKRSYRKTKEHPGTAYTSTDTSPVIGSQSTLTSPLQKRHKTCYDDSVNEYGSSMNGVYPPGGTMDLQATQSMSIEHSKSFLMALFSPDEGKTSIPDSIDVTVSLDEHGNTALHYAAALGKIQILRNVLLRHVDPAVRNSYGETALMRCVMHTHAFDAHVFPEIIAHLASTVECLDEKQRTVFHHTTLSSEMHGNVGRYYLECLLERASSAASRVLDNQDWNGDTAANIAARLGLEGMLMQFIDAGARTNIRNHVGLAVRDFGYSAGSEAPASSPVIPTESSLPKIDFGEIITKCRSEYGEELTVCTFRSTLHQVIMEKIHKLSEDFKKTVIDKNTQIKESRQMLRAITKELAEIRRQNARLKEENQKLPELHHKINALEKCLKEEWVKKSEYEARPTSISSNASQPHRSVDDMRKEIETLQRQVSQQSEITQSLRSELFRLKSDTNTQELQCKRIIASCCGISLDQVDGLLTPLLQAVECDQDADIAEVVSFMSRVDKE